ncbi:hypothetical protein [Ralstonia sp. A12]|uniref:hypothetical protein n=1 Tax=Ralstonia sp. A12 TaxID=1217052 RepID=UPI000693B245|nr:hypothetical protein [Ralstonia sp. A12]
MTRTIISLALACACTLSPAAFGQATAELASTEPVAKTNHDYWALDGLSARMHRATAVTLYLTDPGLLPLRAMDEAQLKRSGCEYTTEDAALITKLVEAVDGASLRHATFSPQFEPREAVYLTLGSGGGEIRLLLEKPYPDQAALLGRVDDQPVTVSSSFVETLYQWAAKLSPVDKCEPFIRQYRR